MSLPTRPGDIPPGAGLAELVASYHQFASRLVDARHGVGVPLPAGELATHAVAALATQHALAERVLASRWCLVRDALTFGAGVDRVAAAMGLDVDEVTVGLSSWADGQHRYGLITDAGHAEVLALLRPTT